MKKCMMIWLAAGIGFAARGENPFAAADAAREARFANPPARDRILPIHHGRSNDAAKTDAEIDGLVGEGFGGLATNVSFDRYLDDPAAWQTFRRVVDRAHSKGLEIWLYDEKGYPSATAGGKTLEGHPEWQARAYLIAVTNVPAGSAALPPSPPGKPVATLRRRAADNRTDTVFVVTDSPILDGTHISVSVSSFKYPYPNLLLAEPTARFIELTHEAYRRELGPAIKHITSTFTDEPSLMTYWMRPMPYLCLPISDDLLAAYLAAGHTTVAEDIPDLVRGEPVGAVAAKRHRFWSLVGERVARNFSGQLTAWASRNGIESGGHLLMEEHVVGHVPLYGDFFRVLRGLSAPSCDILTSVPEQVPWITPMLVGSAGELNGAHHVMSEASDHSQKYRPKGDTRPVYQVSAREVVGSLNRQIWGGVNTFTSYYRWNDFKSDDKRAINLEIGRSLTLAREGHSAADIALLYPSDSLMIGFEPSRHGANGGPEAVHTAELFKAAGRALFSANRSFMIVDDDTIAAAEIKNGMLAKGNLRWRTVILPGVNTLPTAVARKLAAFQLAGGLVIALGDLPVNSTRLFPDREIHELASTWTFLAEDRADFLADFLALRHPPALQVVAAGAGRPPYREGRAPSRPSCHGALRTSHRRSSNGDVFFVMNDTGAEWSGTVRFAQDAPARIWDPRTGKFTDHPAGELALKLPPYAAVVITTPKNIDGTLVAGGDAAAFKPRLAPLPVEPKGHSFGKGQFVAGGVKPVQDAAREGACGTVVRGPTVGSRVNYDVDVKLTKGGVDTFAFLNFPYEKPPFAVTATGVGFSVSVPESTGGTAICGVFLVTRNGQRWYRRGVRSLSEAGSGDVFFAFAGFAPFGKRVSKNPRLDPAEIISVEFGFGGYYGRAEERVHFTVSTPHSIELR